MTEARPANAAPRPRGGPRRPVRWGAADLLLIQLVSLVITTIVAAPAYEGGKDPSATFQFGVLLPTQQLTVLLGLVLVSRWKGRGSLRRDFGLGLDPKDARVIPLGFVLQFAFSLASLPLLILADNDQAQQILEDLEDSRGLLPAILFVVGAVVMAPLVEELLYRGLLLRALARRFEPQQAVLGSAVIFAGMHAIFDPNSLPLVPALAGLGIILGLRALRTGSLSQPILIHAGFNLATAVLYLVADSG